MGSQNSGSGMPFSKILSLVLIVIAAFFVLRLIAGVIRYVLLGALVVFVAWLFLGSDDGASGSG
jgi:hypothetical protein